MVWYVAVVAVLNLALGFGIARLMGVGSRSSAYAIDDALEADEL